MSLRSEGKQEKSHTTRSNWSCKTNCTRRTSVTGGTHCSGETINARITCTWSNITKSSNANTKSLSRSYFIKQCKADSLVIGDHGQDCSRMMITLLMTLLIGVHSGNDSRMYFLIVLTTDYCWRSWTSRIAAPYNLALVD